MENLASFCIFLADPAPNPAHSMQGAIVRAERAKSLSLQKDSVMENDDTDGDDENKDEKMKPLVYKEKDIFEFLGNKSEVEYDYESWLSQLQRIAAQLYNEDEEESEDEFGNKYTSPTQKAFKVIVESTWFEKIGKESLEISWEKI
jgi:hypothetical protein